MPAKLTIKKVRQFIETYDVNHECELLSTEYINNSTPLKLKCNICGEEFKRDFNHIQKKRFMCPKCSGILSGKKSRKYTIETIQSFLEKHDINHECELLSTEYHRPYDKLLFKCNICGQTFTRNFTNLRNIKTGHYCCRSCGHARISPEQACRDFSEHGFTMLGEYVNAVTPVLCECEHGHQNYICHFWLSAYKYPCKDCRKIATSRENNVNWSGGRKSPPITYISRCAATHWRNNILAKYNYRCDISGTTEKLHVHHLNTNYKDIVIQAINNLGLELFIKASCYSTEEILLIRQEVARLHETVDGVVISKKYHNLFHKMYGKTNNTKEQYEEFKQYCLNNIKLEE